jgi:hypothetical protein
MKNKFKNSTIFANLQIKPLVSEEKDKYLALASLSNLKKFVPDIDTDKNIDLLPIAFDACVVNRINKNGDVIDSATASEIAQNFINKPINIEHDRTKVIGCILTASFSKFGTNEPISQSEVKDLNGPFYITLGGVIWKVINPKLSNLIEESNDPSSENYMKVSASWELGFNDYNLALLKNDSKSLEDAEIITDDKEVQKLSKNLKSLGGNGKINNSVNVYRQVIGNVIPLGVGLTYNPAADVEGVAVKDDSIEVELSQNDEESESAIQTSENNISQNEENNVKEEGVINRIIMKIENINQITDELLKQATASSITDFIQDELKKASEAFVAEKSEKDNAIKAAQEKYESLSVESEKVKEELEKLKASLAKLEEEKLAKEKEESFNIRMASLDEEFDLSDEDRKIIADDIKNLTEETFAAYKNKMSVLMKEKNKAAKKAKEDASKKEKEMMASQASTLSATEVVDEALETSKVEKTSIPNSSTATELTLKEKFSNAFGLEGFDIK